MITLSIKSCICKDLRGSLVVFDSKRSVPFIKKYTERSGKVFMKYFKEMISIVDKDGRIKYKSIKKTIVTPKKVIPAI